MLIFFPFFFITCHSNHSMFWQCVQQSHHHQSISYLGSAEVHKILLAGPNWRYSFETTVGHLLQQTFTIRDVRTSCETVALIAVESYFSRRLTLLWKGMAKSANLGYPTVLLRQPSVRMNPWRSPALHRKLASDRINRGAVVYGFQSALSGCRKQPQMSLALVWWKAERHWYMFMSLGRFNAQQMQRM